MTTSSPESPARASAPVGAIERHNRATRWFHALIYTAGLTLLATGWWLLMGGEGKPSPLARVTGVPD
ncbi:MAG: hypothetical protein ACRDJ0_05130, partial [Actinomycetota bacterium]